MTFKTLSRAVVRAGVAAAIFGAVLFSASGHIFSQIRRSCSLMPSYDVGRFHFGPLEGLNLENPTSLQFGPDGRLYVAVKKGDIHVFSIRRDGPGRYRATAAEKISSLREIPNHDDDGTARPDIVDRLVTGILVAGTSEAPLMYAASSDPRIFDPLIDSNSGVVSRLDQSHGEWIRRDLIRGLPRSKHDHASNGLALDEKSNALYLAQGGNTNLGAPSKPLWGLPETVLSGAVLRIDLDALDESPFDLPTLDDEDRPGEVDASDPFGGNFGKNQAIEPDHGPLSIYATGFRNPYDLALTDHGLYTIDNGVNDWIGGPVWVDPESGAATNEMVEGGIHMPEALHRIPGPGYYGGFPNPTRANIGLIANPSRYQRITWKQSPREALLVSPPENPDVLRVFDASTNGLSIYRSGALGEPMREALLAVDIQSRLWFIQFDETGERVANDDVLLSKWAPMPLDVTSRSDDEEFPGTIWVADFGLGGVHVLEPRPGEPFQFSRMAEIWRAGLPVWTCETLTTAADWYVEAGWFVKWRAVWGPS